MEDMVVKEGIIKRIHVNQHNIRNNGKDPKRSLPVITCKTSSANIKTNTLEIIDDSGNVIATIMYRPDKPLGCGAKVWIETKCKVRAGSETSEGE